MDEIWDRIEAWLAANEPAVLAGLNGPATEQELDATERALGVTLPEDVRASYRRHNGLPAEAGYLFQDGEFLSLERIREEWGVWNRLVRNGTFNGMENDEDGTRVRRDWWHPAWIPFTHNGCGDHLCLDLAPGPQGVVGQIVETWHDMGSRGVVATGFREWLTGVAARLEDSASFGG